MSNIYTSADQLIGKTPLLELTHVEKWTSLWQAWAPAAAACPPPLFAD